MTAHISHSAAFRAQPDLAVEAKIKVGKSVWSAGVAGDRLYTLVLSKNPGSVQKAIDKAASLDPPFTPKATMGHLKWLFTAGQLEVDGTSYQVPAKPAKEPKAPKVKVAKKVKAEPKAEPKVAALRKRNFVRTKKLAKRS
jgi:hypothetical protein